jgi:uncharacterized protein with von Willebrand factor type A (vWA) domain
LPEKTTDEVDTPEWSVRSLLADEEIHKLIAKPREIPRRMREEISEIVIRELLNVAPIEIKDLPKFVEKYGAFYSILSTIKNSPQWAEIKELAGKNKITAMLSAKTVIDQIFDLMENFLKYQKEMEDKTDNILKKLLEEFSKIVEETLKLWGRRNEGMPPEGEILFPYFNDFHKKEKSGEMLNEIVQIGFINQISEEIEKIRDELDTIELLYLLFPGRLWDYSLVDLHKEYLEHITQYSHILEQIREIKKMIELLGRIELEYGSKRLTITNFGSSEVFSVGISKDIQHTLPIELVKLKDNTLRNVFFANYSEGKLLTYQLRGKYWAGGPPKKRKRGPVVALVDTSGSMHGEPEILAKALVLAIVRIMLKKDRDVKVILFSSTNQTYEIELTSKTKMASEFLNFMNMSFRGGTDFNTAFAFGINILEEKKWKSADLLFITDGLSQISEETLIQKWNKLKIGNDARIFTLIIGNNTAGGLEKMSDNTYILANGDAWKVSESPSDIIKVISNN